MEKEKLFSVFSHRSDVTEENVEVTFRWWLHHHPHSLSQLFTISSVLLRLSKAKRSVSSLSCMTGM